jgi:hypothetical protein
MRSYVGKMGSCPVVPRANEPHTNLCMLYTAWFLMFKHWFGWKYQYKKYMFNFIDHLQFYFCECLHRYGPQCTALTGAYIADKTVLTVRHSSFTLHENVSALHNMVYQYCLCMFVVLIDIFVIKLFSYDLKDHIFILQTPASTTPFRLYNGWYHPRTSTS